MEKHAVAAVKHSAAVVCCIVGEAVTEEAAAVEQSAVVWLERLWLLCGVLDDQ